MYKDGAMTTGFFIFELWLEPKGGFYWARREEWSKLVPQFLIYLFTFGGLAAYKTSSFALSYIFLSTDLLDISLRGILPLYYIYLISGNISSLLFLTDLSIEGKRSIPLGRSISGFLFLFLLGIDPP